MHVPSSHLILTNTAHACGDMYAKRLTKGFRLALDLKLRLLPLVFCLYICGLRLSGFQQSLWLNLGLKVKSTWK